MSLSCHPCEAITVALPLSPPHLPHSTSADVRVYFNASTIEVQEDAGAVELTLMSSVAVDQPFTVTLRASPSEGGAIGVYVDLQYITWLYVYVYACVYLLSK